MPQDLYQVKIPASPYSPVKGTSLIPQTPSKRITPALRAAVKGSGQEFPGNIIDESNSFLPEVVRLNKRAV